MAEFVMNSDKQSKPLAIKKSSSEEEHDEVKLEGMLATETLRSRGTSEGTLLEGVVETDQDESDAHTLSSMMSDIRSSVQSAFGFGKPETLESLGLLLNVAITHQKDMIVVKSKKSESHFSCPRTLPHPSLWPSKVLLRETACHYGWDEKSLSGPVPTNGIAYDFETALFKGRVMFRVASLESAQDYFKGRARLSSTVITGQFKQELGFEEVQTGQEFCQPIRLPAALLSRALVQFFKLIAPLLQIYLGDQSYCLSPIAQTAQVIHVGDEPFELSASVEVEENFAEFEKLPGAPLIALQRKKYFSSRKNLVGRTFKTDKHYTFDFYNDKLDMETFKLYALGQEFNVQKYIKGQPLRILTRLQRAGDPSELYLWNFELWHAGVVDHLTKVSSECCDTE